MEGPTRPLVLWDGQCAFCRCCIAWVRQRDQARTLHPIPFQDLPSPPMTPELYQRCQQAVHVLFPDGRFLQGAQACLYILEVLGYRRLVALLRLWPLRRLVDTGYTLVARYRRWFVPLCFFWRSRSYGERAR